MPFTSSIVPSSGIGSVYLLNTWKTQFQSSTGWSVVDDFTFLSNTRVMVVKLSSAVSGRAADLYLMFRTRSDINDHVYYLVMENYRTSDKFVQRPTWYQSAYGNTQQYGQYAADSSLGGTQWFDVLNLNSEKPGGATASISYAWQYLTYNGYVSSAQEWYLATTTQGLTMGQRGQSNQTYIGFYDSAIPTAATNDPFPSVQFTWGQNMQNSYGFSTRMPMLGGKQNYGAGGTLQNGGNYRSVIPWYDFAFPGSPDYKGELYQEGKVPLSAIPVVNVLFSGFGNYGVGPESIGFYRGVLNFVRYATFNSGLVSYGDYLTVDGKQWINLGNARWVRSEA